MPIDAAKDYKHLGDLKMHINPCDECIEKNIHYTRKHLDLPKIRKFLMKFGGAFRISKSNSECPTEVKIDCLATCAASKMKHLVEEYRKGLLCRAIVLKMLSITFKLKLYPSTDLCHDFKV